MTVNDEATMRRVFFQKIRAPESMATMNTNQKLNQNMNQTETEAQWTLSKVMRQEQK